MLAGVCLLGCGGWCVAAGLCLHGCWSVPAGVCLLGCASKGGQLSLTRQLALEYAEDNIRVLAVNPGTIDTPLVQEALDYLGGDEAEMRKNMATSHPLGRIGKPEDIANIVLFLASNQASFMTGENICVDGGLMAKGAWDS